MKKTNLIYITFQSIPKTQRHLTKTTHKKNIKKFPDIANGGEHSQQNTHTHTASICDDKKRSNLNHQADVNANHNYSNVVLRDWKATLIMWLSSYTAALLVILTPCWQISREQTPAIFIFIFFSLSPRCLEVRSEWRVCFFIYYFPYQLVCLFNNSHFVYFTNWFVCLFSYQFLCLSIWLFMDIYLLVHLFIYPFACLFTNVSVHSASPMIFAILT